MREGDVKVLVSRCVGHIVLLRHESVECGVCPGESNCSRSRGAVAGVVVVHYVVCVFEAEPFVGGEEVEGAERGGAADYGFVAAEEGHGVDVLGREVEGCCGGVEACCWGCGVEVEKVLLLQIRIVPVGFR